MPLLRRLGNKSRMAAKLLPYFPPHDIYVEPFFGAGGMFFNKPRAAHNFLNDSDNEVFNLYMVAMNDRDRLKFELSRMPVHQSLWRLWKTEIPTDPVLKAVRFLFYSNFGYMGMGTSLHIKAENPMEAALNELEGINLTGCKFTCDDFEAAIRSICLPETERAFIYSDPPYFEDGDKRAYTPFTQADLSRLFDVLAWRGCKYAISEFDNPIVVQMAKDRGLQVHIVGARQNMKNRRTEILITNYEPSIQQSLF